LVCIRARYRPASRIGQGVHLVGSKPPGGHRLACMVRHRFARDQRLSGRQVRREPVAPANPRYPPGESQTGSQRRQFQGEFEPRPATINAANSHIERLQAISRYSREVPSKQRVAGSNPAGRATTEPQLKAYIGRQTGTSHYALPRYRARFVPDSLGPDRPISAAARLLSASAMTCCRSSLPCR